MQRRHLSRWLALAVALPLALAGAAPATAADPVVPGDPPLTSYPGTQVVARAAVTSVPTTPLPCDSNGSDKAMTRADVLNRARSWLTVGIPYSQRRCYRNTYGDYRTDCSGFVSMAWGLGGAGSAFWTGNLDSRSRTISRADLQPGDALLRHDGVSNHVALFVRWADSGHTRPVVMEQTGSRGTIQDTWSSSDAATYTPIRYDNIVEDGTTRNTVPDVTGDGFADLVGSKPDGSLWLYANNIVRDDGVPYSAGRQIGSGWGAFNRVLVADVTGDGFADQVATKPDGSLWLYANNYVRDDGVPFNAGQQIGAGWNAFDRLVAADVTGDGYTDLVATKPDGSLWLYGNNIVRDNGTPFNAGRQIGTGWNNLNRITGADVTGDGYTDLVATKPDGSLWLYGNNIVRDNGTPFNASRQIGTGWNNLNRITGADVTGDGYTDLVATKPDGSLWLYANNIVRDDGVPYNSSRQIGAGWNAFDRVIA
ncbi:hypothetical protein GCM10020358_50100 [Amorphoplanes nipponensis]|uniref:C40 family peptidase n=1 Tax=Actinoplanes nipponensis TaxID=135950 RepID=UPI0031EC8D09